VNFTRDKDFPRLRTKGFTGLEQLIEKNPRVINEQTIVGMLPSLTDSSPLVRDSTLNLYQSVWNWIRCLNAMSSPQCLR